MPLNFTILALAWLLGSIFLLPLAIIAIRFAILPLAESITRRRSEPAGAATLQRVARLEDHVARLAAQLEQIAGSEAARG